MYGRTPVSIGISWSQPFRGLHVFAVHRPPLTYCNWYTRHTVHTPSERCTLKSQRSARWMIAKCNHKQRVCLDLSCSNSVSIMQRACAGASWRAARSPASTCTPSIRSAHPLPSSSLSVCSPERFPPTFSPTHVYILNQKHFAVAILERPLSTLDRCILVV